MANRGRPRKNSKELNVYVDRDVLNHLDIWYKKTGIPKSTIVEKALICYLTALDNKEPKEEKINNSYS